MTLTKTTVSTGALESFTATGSHPKQTCSPTEIHALQMLMCGCTSGRLEEWPVLVRVLRRKGFKFDPKTPTLKIKLELQKDCYKIDPYCDEDYDRLLDER